MTREASIYDLMLMLSMSADDERRAKILADAQATISSGGGSIERQDDWGRRPLTYRIAHQPEAEYHLLQFSGSGPLLESLSHSLRIADGVLRFRIIKVRAGTPAAPASAPPVIAVAPGAVGTPAAAPPPAAPTPAAPTPAPSPASAGAEAGVSA
ncbi:MAG: 30S ribosomal protein S6 [Solirubrobacteraceae bacterium]